MVNICVAVKNSQGVHILLDYSFSSFFFSNDDEELMPHDTVQLPILLPVLVVLLIIATEISPWLVASLIDRRFTAYVVYLIFRRMS
jgi:hypothetical protein